MGVNEGRPDSIVNCVGCLREIDGENPAARVGDVYACGDCQRDFTREDYLRVSSQELDGERLVEQADGAA